VIIATTAN